MTDKPEMPELLPCPFCGGEANAYQHNNSEAFVICSCCFGRNSVAFPCKQSAIKAWNTRADKAVPEVVLKLIKSCEEELEWLKTTADCERDNVRIVGFEDCLRQFKALQALGEG